MKKLLVLFFVVAMCLPSFGSILVYKTTTTTTVLSDDTAAKESLKGYLVVDVNVVGDEITGVNSAQQIIYNKTEQYAKSADVAFTDAGTYAFAEYGFEEKDAVLVGKTKLTYINAEDQVYVPLSLKGSLLDNLGTGTMTATFDKKKTISANSEGMSISETTEAIQGDIDVEIVTDSTPPDPNAMTFASDPNAISDTEITMTATTATDADTPPVQYYFTNVTDPNHNSGWQSSPTWTDTDLDPETTYTYNVKARDGVAPVANETAASADVNATTQQTPDTNAPTPDPMTFAVDPNAVSDSSITMTATTASDVHGVQYYFTNVTDTNHNSGWQDSATFTDTGLDPATTYTYNVKARDNSLAHNTTAASNDVNAATDADTSAPTPNPLTWATEPYASGSSSIIMQATVADDSSGGVTYQFWRTTGTTAIVRDWNADANFIATGLTENTIYGYKVRAKDAGGHMTDFSETKTAQTGKTIQTLIDEALALRTGEEPVTVTIPAGTYTGDIAVNDPNVILTSAAGAATTIIQLVDGVGIDVQAGAASFILNGFTVQPDDADTTFAIQLTNAPADVNIANNIIDVNSNAATIGISVGAAGADGLTIIGNSITIASAHGAIWGPDVSNVLVQDNTISGPSAHITSGYAVEFAGITGDSLITGNTITNTGYGVFLMAAGAGGGTTVAEDAVISNNTITQCQKGVTLGHSSHTEDMNGISVIDNAIQNNVIGLYIPLATDDTLIDVASFTVTGNTFSGNITYGAQNLDTNEELSAELNWWGNASGPYNATTNAGGLGDEASDDIDFDPWYISSAKDANSAD